MPCTEHQKNVWEHRKGFYKQFFHWYGWASTTKPITFFSTDLQSLEKKSVFSRLLNLNPQWGKWRCVLI